MNIFMLLELRKELGINSANYFTSQYLTPMKREGYIEIEKGVNMCNSRVDPRIRKICMLYTLVLHELK